MEMDAHFFRWAKTKRHLEVASGGGRSGKKRNDGGPVSSTGWLEQVRRGLRALRRKEENPVALVLCNGSTDAYSGLAAGFGLDESLNVKIKKKADVTTKGASRANATATATGPNNNKDVPAARSTRATNNNKDAHLYFERLGHNNIMNRNAVWAAVFGRADAAGE